ncbi:antitoxin VapB family protein [Pyrobaculum sp.]|uniref:antitoxin VapB family protein n=1 Tax=Pyrobaculum sp. TaxID=2004705 RepID=UPI003D097377
MSTTITISRETKALLEALKGGRTWDEFLRELAQEAVKRRREDARRALAEMLEEEAVERARWTRY